ncbi:MAG: SAM-dependent methyltransferase [Bacteroidia bacterium]|nr:SAM-dependent methyltransferase [Bacteroidia bacterium]
MAKLFLVPNVLSEGDWQNVLPSGIFSIVTQTKYFIVEDVRTARRFLKQVNKEIDIDTLTFFELNKYTSAADLPGFLNPAEQGHNMAVISEAGCPGVADPGADVVKIAHQKGIAVVPLVGPSSILLALMASGMNGQNFAFNGYLPVKPHERARAIQTLEKMVKTDQQTQIFIETPYRNMKTLADILSFCQPETKLCIAADITLSTEYIKTKSVQGWKGNLPDLNKRPCIFILYK